MQLFFHYITERLAQSDSNINQQQLYTKLTILNSDADSMCEKTYLSKHQI